jgi:soluble lytic murein transglycosylase-like protein
LIATILCTRNHRGSSHVRSRSASWLAVALLAPIAACGAQVQDDAAVVRPGGPEQERVADRVVQSRPSAAMGRRAALAQVDDDAILAPDVRTPELSTPASKPLTINGKMASRCRQLRPAFERAAQASGLDVHLLLAIAWVESGFNPSAQSSAGAMGVMQLVPRTSSAFGCEDPAETRCATAAASNYLLRLMRQFDGDLVYTLCAYHSGAAQAQRSLRAGVLPPNLAYAERIFEARARLERYGCDGRDVSSP